MFVKENISAKGLSIIALSADIALFKNERILDPLWAKKFPGAEWMPTLSDNLTKRGFRVTTTDVALSHVEQGYWNVENVCVIQHLNDPESERLIELGAKPLIVTAFESPLYVPKFYDEVNIIASKFRHRMFFSGLLNGFLDQQGSNHHLRFPCYHEEDIVEAVAWCERDFLVTVVANKYALPFSRLYLFHPVDALKWLKRCLRTFISFDISKLMKVKNANQLQDIRYSAFCFFGKKGGLKLYGKGWETLKNLPYVYRKKLSPILSKLKPEVCNHKLQTIAQYKFSLCFENCSYPGYVTEKIIECFVAGVIPVYLGAPDIKDFVPEASFIDVRDYTDWDELLVKLESIDENEAKKMIQSGRDFLKTDVGKLHSFEGFSALIESIVINTKLTKDE